MGRLSALLMTMKPQVSLDGKIDQGMHRLQIVWSVELSNGSVSKSNPTPMWEYALTSALVYVPM